MKESYKVLGHLIQYGHITANTAADMYGIKQLTQIIYTLRSRGFNISTDTGSSNAVFRLDTEHEMQRYNSCITQEELIYLHLLAFGSISGQEAYNRYGVKTLSSVIVRLRAAKNVTINYYRNGETKSGGKSEGRFVLIKQIEDTSNVLSPTTI